MTLSSRRRFIICLDATLLIIFLLLLAPRLTGLALHEVLGFLFFIPLILHLLVAWPWIQKSVVRFFKTSGRSRLNLCINMILFLLVITELASGLFISQVLLPAFGIKTVNDRVWRYVHNVTLNFTVLFIGLHVAINWGWIASVFKRQLHVPNEKRMAPSFKISTGLLRSGIIV